MAHATWKGKSAVGSDREIRSMSGHVWGESRGKKKKKGA